MKEKVKAKKQLGAELQNVKGGAARPGENTAKRKKAEEAFQESEEKYRNLFEKATVIRKPLLTKEEKNGHHTKKSSDGIH